MFKYKLFISLHLHFIRSTSVIRSRIKLDSDAVCNTLLSFKNFIIHLTRPYCLSSRYQKLKSGLLTVRQVAWKRCALSFMGVALYYYSNVNFHRPVLNILLFFPGNTNKHSFPINRCIQHPAVLCTQERCCCLLPRILGCFDLIDCFLNHKLTPDNQKLLSATFKRKCWIKTC